MDPVDVIIGALLLGGALYGFFQGLLRQIAGVVAWLAGIAAALAFTPALSGRIESSTGMDIATSIAVAFVLITVATAVAVKAVGWLAARLAARSRLSGVFDKALGAPVGALAVALVLTAAVVVIDWRPTASPVQERVRRSVLAQRMLEAARVPLAVRDRRVD
ncbi:MAG TPA: CvpA family protein [Terriglobales bacterium]|nr:CvpA family protein [Terriglobales bacterium]